MSIELLLRDSMHRTIGIASLHQFYGDQLPPRAGIYRYRIALKGLWLAAGSYSVDATTSITNVRWDHYVEHAAGFDVQFSSPGEHGWDFRQEAGLGVLALLAEAPPSFELVQASHASPAQ
jgi:hypothetical protein